MTISTASAMQAGQSASEASALILASASATRARLLRAAGLSFEIRAAEVDEQVLRAALPATAGPAEVARHLAEEKARAVSNTFPGRLILGADQVLAIDGQMLAKPANCEEAGAQLRHLRGRAHQLHAAAAVVENGHVVWSHVGDARLWMRPFSDCFLEAYLRAVGDVVLESVGCYQLEGLGVQLFERIEGDWFSILGLPLVELLAWLRHRGVIMG